MAVHTEQHVANLMGHDVTEPALNRCVVGSSDASFPVSGSKWQISTGTGVQPMWRGDGKELFFHTLYGEVMAVPITTSKEGAFEAGVPQRLFRANPAILRYSRGGWNVTPDGQRFLMANVAGASNVAPITVVVNWEQGQGR